ncbi:unnamed protein product [Schistosoma margrebowiei]|uniref:Uncharacterized protein n=1 Tax=Schistosoma margrebowiei TaxID=48269 RepID=A0A183LB29_9TREM|nr:unnamed protein product [Schistosoma margrebowiei]
MVVPNDSHISDEIPCKSKENMLSEHNYDRKPDVVLIDANFSNDPLLCNDIPNGFHENILEESNPDVISYITYPYNAFDPCEKPVQCETRVLSPECHSVYYSCEKSPCKNGGRCTLLRELIGDNNAEEFIYTNQGTNDDDDETICICPDNWSGPFCTQPVIDCISENEKYRLSTSRLINRFCLNGGVCIIHPGNSSPRCSCPPEWDGYFCELNKSWSAGRMFGIAFSIIFVIFLILVIGFFVWLCYISRHSNIPQHPTVTYLSNFPYNGTVSDNDSHENTRIYMKHEKIFDISESNLSPVKLSTFGDNANSQKDTRKIENLYEVPYTTNKIKQNDVNFNSRDRNGSPFTTIQSTNENIYVNYNTLMSKELRIDLEDIRRVTGS